MLQFVSKYCLLPTRYYLYTILRPIYLYTIIYKVLPRLHEEEDESADSARQLSSANYSSLGKTHSRPRINLILKLWRRLDFLTDWQSFHFNLPRLYNAKCMEGQPKEILLFPICSYHIRWKGRSATLRREAVQAKEREEGFASPNQTSLTFMRKPNQRSLTLTSRAQSLLTLMRKEESRMDWTQFKLKSALILLTSQDPSLSGLLQGLLPHS